MSDFKAKMQAYLILFRLGLPHTPLGELTALTRPPTWIKGRGLLLRGWEGTGRRGEGEGEGDGRGWERREREGGGRKEERKSRGGERTRPHPFTPSLIHISGYPLTLGVAAEV